MKTKNTEVKKKKFGGKQENAGRPKGKKNASTIEREAILELIKNKTAERAMKLIERQTMLGYGSMKVFRIDTRTVGTGKDKKRIREKPVLVTDDDEIIAALDYQYAHGESPNDDDTYYFVTIKDPENKAIDSLLDRTFGKAKENIAVKHEGLSLKKLYGKIDDE